MPEEIELDPVDFITIGTIGPKGQRVFHLQAGRDEQLITLTFEKEQASALAESIANMLREIEEEFSAKTGSVVLSDYDMDLREPILPLFRVGQIGLGYDNVHDRLMVIFSELQNEGAEGEPRIVRLSATREQMSALAESARNVVQQGRARPESNGFRMHY